MRAGAGGEVFLDGSDIEFKAAGGFGAVAEQLKGVSAVAAEEFVSS